MRITTPLTLSIRSFLNPIVTKPPPLGVKATQRIPKYCPPVSSRKTTPLARLHTVTDAWCPFSPTASIPPSLENAKQLTVLLARKYLGIFVFKGRQNDKSVDQGEDRGMEGK